MIFDHITNAELYKGISPDIYHVKLDVEDGVYQINPRVRAIVSEYETKLMNENGYEAHKKFIDIQYVLKGEERVCCMPIEKLKETKPYSEDIDATFYEVSNQPQEMIIGNGYFTIYLPQDGHMPQLCVAGPQIVKKVVVKVEIV